MVTLSYIFLGMCSILHLSQIKGKQNPQNPELTRNITKSNAFIFIKPTTSSDSADFWWEGKEEQSSTGKYKQFFKSGSLFFLLDKSKEETLSDCTLLGGAPYQ